MIDKPGLRRICKAWCLCPTWQVHRGRFAWPRFWIAVVIYSLGWESLWILTLLFLSPSILTLRRELTTY